MKDHDVEERQRIPQLETKAVAVDLFAWLVAQGQKVLNGSATAEAIDFGLSRWPALMRYLDVGCWIPSASPDRPGVEQFSGVSTARRAASPIRPGLRCCP